MTYRFPKQAKKLLEQQHTLPYLLYTDNGGYQVTIYTTLGKISGIVIQHESGKTADEKETEAILFQLQKYYFYFEYLRKRLALVKEKDSSIAEKIEVQSAILEEQVLFDEKIQPKADALKTMLHVFDQQQCKMDVYQEDISLLNEKIKLQQKITSEDWEAAEDLAIAFGTSAYAQSIYLQDYRSLRKALQKWTAEQQKQLPAAKRRELNKLLTLLSDTNAGLVFDHILSLVPRLEENLMLDKERSKAARISEFQKEFGNYLKFYKPDIAKVKALVRK